VKELAYGRIKAMATAWTIALIHVTCPPIIHFLFGPGGKESSTPGVNRRIIAI
jgi:hypothetical protein